MLHLGHVILDGVIRDPEKINVIKNYLVPQTVDEVKRFVTLANYYRKFIDNFADIAYPLNQLCKKILFLNGIKSVNVALKNENTA